MYKGGRQQMVISFLSHHLPCSHILTSLPGILLHLLDFLLPFHKIRFPDLGLDLYQMAFSLAGLREAFPERK